ncbi:hypothetical protein YC2023_053343 [Brassica napus]
MTENANQNLKNNNCILKTYLKYPIYIIYTKIEYFGYPDSNRDPRSKKFNRGGVALLVQARDRLPSSAKLLALYVATQIWVHA